MRTGNLLSKRLSIWIALLGFFVFSSCSERDGRTAKNETFASADHPVKNDNAGKMNIPVVKMCWFQQQLLRDAVIFLNEQTNVKISMSNSVANVNDLAIDSENLSGKPLNDILDYILKYLNGTRSIHLRWKWIDENSILIYRTDGNAEAAKVM